MKILSTSLHAFFLAIYVTSASATESSQVNFRSFGGDPRDPQSGIKCKYDNILKSRPAPKQGDAPTAQIVLNDSTIQEPENGLACETAFSNLTNLNQRFVQEEIGNILKDIPCKPGVPLTLVSQHATNKTAQRIYNLRTPWIVWEMHITGCLEDKDGYQMTLPGECAYPSFAVSSQSEVEYDEMIAMLKKCRESLIKQVHDEKLLEQWQADNDPNKSGTSVEIHRKRN